MQSIAEILQPIASFHRDHCIRGPQVTLTECAESAASLDKMNRSFIPKSVAIQSHRSAKRDPTVGPASWKISDFSRRPAAKCCARLTNLPAPASGRVCQIDDRFSKNRAGFVSRSVEVDKFEDQNFTSSQVRKTSGKTIENGRL
jgi:hypothetical protein